MQELRGGEGGQLQRVWRVPMRLLGALHREPALPVRILCAVNPGSTCERIDRSHLGKMYILWD